jgi:hypothetical protein
MHPESNTCSLCGWQEPKPETEIEGAPTVRQIIGLDLGQVSDYTALALLKQTTMVEGGKSIRRYACPFLRRWPLGTPYPKIVSDVKEFIPSLGSPAPFLVADATGVGRAVIDQLRAASLSVSGLIAVNITGGHQVTRTFTSVNVPKKELVSAVRSVLEGRRLQIARQLKEAPTLRKELGTFTTKITTAGNESYEALRARDHDDLVLAVALALWRGENAIEYKIVTLPI